MSMLAEIVKTTAEHLQPVADAMRDADVKEVLLSSNRTPQEALFSGFRDSDYCWTILLDSEPIGIFGVSSVTILGDTGVPWLLGTNGMLKIRRQFIVDSRKYVDLMNSRYRHLVNFVHADNRASLRWLKTLGFTIHEPVKAGPFDAMFHKFERFADV